MRSPEEVVSVSPDLLRLRMDLAYDGTHFSGWATQPGFRTVQETVERAWGVILRDDPPSLTVGGRTDAGVHARGSVAHLDVRESRWGALPGRTRRPPEDSAWARLSGVLPDDIVVRQVRVAPPGFDARFSALHRRYTYRICDRRAMADPLRRFDTVELKQSLDVAAMNAASATLLGLHDFASFCRRREGATTIRTLERFSWTRHSDGTVVGSLIADAFCHSMVRALVGAVIPVGTGREAVSWPVTVREGRRRHSAVTVMPAHGLCLEEIVYPNDEGVAARAAQARARRDGHVYED
ncbi:MAG: tRNA pseudouridine(38-40) synthase TruA [Ornithinimicrobium sp.]